MHLLVFYTDSIIQVPSSSNHIGGICVSYRLSSVFEPPRKRRTSMHPLEVAQKQQHCTVTLFSRGLEISPFSVLIILH
jgi:hypothetical protein